MSEVNPNLRMETHIAVVKEGPDDTYNVVEVQVHGFDKGERVEVTVKSL